MKRLSFSTDRFLKEFSTFGIGGPIRYFAEIVTVDEMQGGLSFALQNDLPYLVIGKGSNCLFPDRGFNGVVLLNKIDFCYWKDAAEKSIFESSSVYVEVGAGFSFSLLGVQSARRGLCGLEFASGIPATVGGAVFMNAGANGQQTCDSLTCVGYLHENGKIQRYLKDELVFEYRHSSFQQMKGVIVYAGFTLGKCEMARDKQLAIIDYRIQTQPLKEKSAGCVFRNPKDKSAGALIDQCGLKGFKVGRAKVSEVHANFIVNEEGASAEDVLGLIQMIQERVFQETGIFLETEIKII